MRAYKKRNFTTKEIVSFFPLLTFHVHAATFQQHLHIEYISVSICIRLLIFPLSMIFQLEFECWCSTPLSAIFQLYHGDQSQWWRKPERTTDPGQATGKLYHLRLRFECTFFCNLQSLARTHAVLVIGLYELLDPTTQLIEPPGPPFSIGFCKYSDSVVFCKCSDSVVFCKCSDSVVFCKCSECGILYMFRQCGIFSFSFYFIFKK